jgi:hypothetical protein
LTRGFAAGSGRAVTKPDTDAGAGSAPTSGAGETAEAARPTTAAAIVARGRTGELDGVLGRWGVGRAEAVPRACRDDVEPETAASPAEGVSDPAEGASAHATADPAKAAAPTPSATANPPTRPTKLLAAMSPPSP